MLVWNQTENFNIQPELFPHARFLRINLPAKQAPSLVQSYRGRTGPVAYCWSLAHSMALFLLYFPLLAPNLDTKTQPTSTNFSQILTSSNDNQVLFFSSEHGLAPSLLLLPLPGEKKQFSFFTQGFTQSLWARNHKLLSTDSE